MGMRLKNNWKEGWEVLDEKTSRKVGGAKEVMDNEAD